ncbi:MULTISPECIES: hypothetical protein [unclassified Mesorhizobium]|uniref:hypothetical protein n=1 Tax=unclassified Mesorhizobium TaxID=325217 RepID=UPI001FEFD10D|nr:MULTISPECIES: hypothetical protein [unclassified Mesorhizobium]
MEHQSLRQSGFVVDDRIKDRLIDAAGAFLDLSAANSDLFGIGEKLLCQLGD